MAVMTLANGATILYEASAATTTPADAYAAWAAELGVSATATLQALNDDDKGFAIDLASAFFAGGSTKALFSSEGAVGFYKATPAITSSTEYRISNISRMYGLNTRPTLLLSFHPQGDLKSFGVKLQRANGVTILFAQHSTYNNEATYRYNVAIRIGASGNLELVGQAVDRPVNLYLTELAESSTHTVLQQTLALAQAAGSTTRLLVSDDRASGLITATTPLGAALALGEHDVVWHAHIAAASPLQPAVGLLYAQPVAMVSATTPLGAAQALLRHPTQSRVAATTPLGAALALGEHDVARHAHIAAASPLGAAAAVLYHDFSGVPEVANATIFYTCQLVNQGVVLATVPMSSWQATLQVDRANYAQAVFPAIGPVADVLTSLPASAEFVILRGVKLPDGASVQQEMARAPCQTLQFDRGPYNHTCTVRGYTEGFTGLDAAPGGRALRQIRSISSGGGGRRVRCAVDWFLRPGNTVLADGVEMVAAFTNYYVTGNDEYMDVGERA